jgi:hypothetical protein
MKIRIYERLQKALRDENKEFAFLPMAEKKAIHAILQATIKELPPSW